MDLLSCEFDCPSIDPDIEPIVLSLKSRGAVTPHPKNLDKRDNRTIEYFSCFTSEPDHSMFKLKRSKVLILGLGGTGTVVLQNLVAAGIEQYSLVDCDFVEESNLNRQFIYSYRDLGKRKVDVCKKYIEQRLRQTDVSTNHQLLVNESDFSRLIGNESPTIALVAIDHPIDSIVKTATTVLTQYGIPYIVAGVGVRTCILGKVVESEADHRKFIGTSASMSTTNAISASYAAHSIIEWLINVPLDFTVSRHE